MVAGFNMLSFDLFGLGRKALGTKRSIVEEVKPVEKTAAIEEQSQKDEDPEREMFFWSLYPVF